MSSVIKEKHVSSAKLTLVMRVH